MEFTSLILPLTKNICRTCLSESDNAMFMNIQDLIEHELSKVKLIDILVFINCLENNDEENWPQGICATCVSTALAAYNFKLKCLKATTTLSRILMIQSPTNLQRTDSIDINVVYQDHEYDVPLFSNHLSIEFDTPLSSNKELTPLPPVTEITSGNQPPRKESEKRYSCAICCKSFTRIYGLRYHMAKHTDQRQFLCAKCGKKFHTPSGLAQHVISHKETPQFKCGFCNKTYKARQSLKEHFRTAHSSNRKLFVCGTCGKRFTAKSTLASHIKIHNGDKQFACPHCPKKYTRALYLRTHVAVHTGQERPRPFTCSHKDCDRSFTTKHSLLVHIAHTHSTDRPHKCNICFKGFATPSGLRGHKETHLKKESHSSKESRLHKCRICLKSFETPSELKMHTESHIKKESYLNNQPQHNNRDLCFEVFSTQSELEECEEIQTIEEIQAHNCGVCFEGFATLSELKIHKKCHMNKPHASKVTCSTCGETVANKQQLQEHVKIHDVDTNDMILETVVDDVFFHQAY